MRWHINEEGCGEQLQANADSVPLNALQKLLIFIFLSSSLFNAFFCSKSKIYKRI